MRLTRFNLNIGTQLMKALGDEARIRILHVLLAKGPLSISDLELILDFTQTKTSRHITYLKHSGILTYTKIDHWVIYSIKEEVYEVISKILEFLEKDSQLVKDLHTFDTLLSNRELAKTKISAHKWNTLKNI